MKLNQPEIDATDFRRVVELGISEGIIPPDQNVSVTCMIADKNGDLKTARGIVDGFQTLLQAHV